MLICHDRCGDEVRGRIGNPYKQGYKFCSICRYFKKVPEVEIRCYCCSAKYRTKYKGQRQEIRNESNRLEKERLQAEFDKDWQIVLSAECSQCGKIYNYQPIKCRHCFCEEFKVETCTEEEKEKLNKPEWETWDDK